MSHQDTDRHTAFAPHHQAVKQALDWLVNPAQLADLRFRPECTWTPKGLLFAAILWAWSDEKTLTDRFAHARKIVQVMAILPRRPARSYQAFLKMLSTWSVLLTHALVAAFRHRMRADLADRVQVGGFDVFGVDGSRLELPRTQSNEQHFAPAAAQRLRRPKTPGASRRRRPPRAARNRRARAQKVNSPQMWLTLMFHVGTGLPWDWRSGPSGSSERDHLRQMLDALPAGALVTADAGFVGYEIWKALLDSGRQLLIRVGANVRLLTDLGYVRERHGIVYLWPDREAARQHPPLVLRLVVVGDGRQPVYLVTSALDPRRLSDRQVATIYGLRWGIELLYRHVKQTFERRKLRSHRAEHAALEANWSLLGLWSLSLHAQVELARQGVAARRISVAKVLRAYRRSLREYRSCPDRGESLAELLSGALIDPYHRTNKSSRNYPRKKQYAAIGEPKIDPATKEQIRAAARLRDQHALGLTA